MLTYGKFFNANLIPDTNSMIDLSLKLRESIEALLALGLSPIPDIDFKLLEPAFKAAAKIENGQREWVDLVHKACGKDVKANRYIDEEFSQIS